MHWINIQRNTARHTFGGLLISRYTSFSIAATNEFIHGLPYQSDEQASIPPIVGAFRTAGRLAILPAMKKNEADTTGQTPKRGFHLRMPPGVRERVEQSMRVSGRESLNAELVALIEIGLSSRPPEIMEAVSRLHAAVDELNRRLEKEK